MRTHWIRPSALAVAAMVTVAAAPNSLHAQRKQRDLITRAEILNSPQKDGNLYAAIRALRPHFFDAPRGKSLGNSTRPSPLAIYVDRVRQSGGDILQAILANSVAEVRYMDPNKAENEFGLSANGGAILIKRFDPASVADSLNKKPPQ